MRRKGCPTTRSTNRLYVASERRRPATARSPTSTSTAAAAAAVLPPRTPAVRDPRGVAIDPVARIIYWLNNTDPRSERRSPGRGSTAAKAATSRSGRRALLKHDRLTVDPVSGRLYWGNNDGSFHYAPLIGRDGDGGQAGSRKATAAAAASPASPSTRRRVGSSGANPGPARSSRAGLGGTAKEAVQRRRPRR